MLHDAHFHLDDPKLIEVIRKHRIQGIVNADHPKEYLYLKQCFAKREGITISAGIHPWKADRITWEEMLPIMEEARIIGEIGLDHVWCDVAMEIQRKVLEQSLAYAGEHHKPVILHLKGMEKEALSYIYKYPNTYMIHWYSAREYLQEYIKLGCYFTIGPSVGMDKTVDFVAEQVPLDHMMIETDGLHALSWCDGTEVKADGYVSILQRSIQRIARIRHKEADEIQQVTSENFQRFISLANGGKKEKIVSL